jgi:hypothetical protein
VHHNIAREAQLHLPFRTSSIAALWHIGTPRVGRTRLASFLYVGCMRMRASSSKNLQVLCQVCCPAAVSCNKVQRLCAACICQPATALGAVRQTSVKICLKSARARHCHSQQWLGGSSQIILVKYIAHERTAPLVPAARPAEYAHRCLLVHATSIVCTPCVSSLPSN